MSVPGGPPPTVRGRAALSALPRRRLGLGIAMTVAGGILVACGGSDGAQSVGQGTPLVQTASPTPPAATFAPPPPPAPAPVPDGTFAQPEPAAAEENHADVAPPVAPLDHRREGDSVGADEEGLRIEAQVFSDALTRGDAEAAWPYLHPDCSAQSKQDAMSSLPMMTQMFEGLRLVVDVVAVAGAEGSVTYRVEGAPTENFTQAYGDGPQDAEPWSYLDGHWYQALSRCTGYADDAAQPAEEPVVG